MIGSALVTRNADSREALAESLLRFVEEDLDTAPPVAGSASESFRIPQR